MGSLNAQKSSESSAAPRRVRLGQEPIRVSPHKDSEPVSYYICSMICTMSSNPQGLIAPLLSRSLLVASLLCLGASPALAQGTQVQSQAASAQTPEITAPQVLELNWLNQQFLDKQRLRIDELTRKHFGDQLKTDDDPKNLNLILLQRLIDKNVIPASDKMTLQAMGVVLGDAYVRKHDKLRWLVYEDQLGKSHAVCVDGSKHCLFPVTMLSRRIEAGIKPNVNQVFTDGYQTIKGYLPKRPFSD